ncbi:phosphopantetheine-binding protein [Halomonas sp. McH1-25]|uniref:phosphopantetheine-binding protein n=1 Tax=unclassified Halomonas TaxID=2609666 RepID=UPI001EF4B99E|nr:MULTISPECIES: phosphopantetheine-binding protein [unclassified Halomonas]MCG7600167.1 phosphopantetheine-binding protein [Halomonas sp. McH1-25]MCP1341416.1 phosphopantetheine-binding protein [Halomonas sp. FL8]MCP1359639.1 phosphopantetheine-binding protein [Halomonas sp. BBD45]MCP1365707.1 phosphopantetheine-binding protein [Halomonas sp. BBD48]
MTNALELELKQLIIDTLELEDVTPADIDPDEPLFVEGLGLDSIDALELGLALQKTYGIKLEADSEETHQHFANLKSLAALVEARRVK